VVDHSVHGLVALRLVGAPSNVVERVRRRLGPSTGAPSREPDIEVVYSGSLPHYGVERFLGLNRAAYDDEHFYLLDAAGHRASIDLGSTDGRCEIRCERGTAWLPLVVPLIGLRLLAKGHVLLHSSSFVYEGNGVLVAGWQKGGKTETLLAFMAQGASYVSNEWTIVSPDGALRGLGDVVQVWEWHLRDMPTYRARLSASDRRRLALLRLYQRLYRGLPGRVRPGGRLGRALQELSVDGGNSQVGQARVSPSQLFEGSLWEGPAALEHVLLATVAAGATTVAPRDPGEVARRMISSQAYERRDLLAAYKHFRYAFPHQRNELLESADERELSILLQAFRNKSAHEIAHPYPVPLHDLYRVSASVCAQQGVS
jgi:hypothetical protein